MMTIGSSSFGFVGGGDEARAPDGDDDGGGEDDGLAAVVCELDSFSGRRNGGSAAALPREPGDTVRPETSICSSGVPELASPREIRPAAKPAMTNRPAAATISTTRAGVFHLPRLPSTIDPASKSDNPRGAQ